MKISDPDDMDGAADLGDPFAQNADRFPAEFTHLKSWLENRFRRIEQLVVRPSRRLSCRSKTR